MRLQVRWFAMIERSTYDDFQWNDGFGCDVQPVTGSQLLFFNKFPFIFDRQKTQNIIFLINGIPIRISRACATDGELSALFVIK
jgi:hypothetical protein